MNDYAYSIVLGLNQQWYDYAEPDDDRDDADSDAGFDWEAFLIDDDDPDEAAA